MITCIKYGEVDVIKNINFSVNISVKKLCNSVLEEQDISCYSYGKPKRNASKLAQQRINQDANLKLNSKMRRPSSTEYSKVL